MLPLLTQVLALMLAISGFLAAATLEGMHIHHRPQAGATKKSATQLGKAPAAAVAE